MERAKYKMGDIVRFRDKDEVIEGKVYVVDSNGTVEQSKEPSYDIMTENMLYKHIRQSMIL